MNSLGRHWGDDLLLIDRRLWNFELKSLRGLVTGVLVVFVYPHLHPVVFLSLHCRVTLAWLDVRKTLQPGASLRREHLSGWTEIILVTDQLVVSEVRFDP